MNIPEEIFRAYDIRGQVDTVLTPQVMHSIGQALGTTALENEQDTLLLGADARLSSPAFSKAMSAGILASGCNVIDLGVIPTPVLYFATHSSPWHSGVMITGSHNPGDYNGVKIVINQECLAEGQIENIRRIIHTQAFAVGQGHLTSLDITGQYIEQISSDIHLGGQARVVIDCGNGVTAITAEALFRELGCEVIPLYCTLDGRFPNHHPDPTVASNLDDLIEAVALHKADLGIAFDGDGDRLGLVTASGRILNADKMLMAFARDILQQVPDARVVVDIKSSRYLSRLIEEHKGHAITSKSGHSLLKRAMKASNAILGGEFSAHIFFRHRWFGFDDGQYAAARFLELMDKDKLSADAILDSLPDSCSTDELLIKVGDSDKFSIIKKLQQQISLPGASINLLDGIRAEFPDGWGLIRVSNTTPCLTARFEADTDAALAFIARTFRCEILRLFPHLNIPF